MSGQRFISASRLCFIECLLLAWSSRTSAIRENFVTQNCPGTIGPSYGEVLRFDPNSKSDSYVVPSTTLDCWITLRGRPTEPGMPQYYATLTWRTSMFSVRSYNGSGSCAGAYVEVYDAKNDGQPISPPVRSKLCGTTPPTPYTTTSQTIVVRLHVEAPPPTTAVSPVTQTTDTATQPPGATVEPVTSEPELGPFINFTADFTSYFIGSCALDGVANDKQQLQCYNGRCISMSLRCDRFYSNNCGDNGDVHSTPPGNCIYKKPKQPTKFDMLPVWLGVAGLLALLVTYWCCWRPGWFPWRVARLRNVACCRSACSCCYRLSCCRNGCCGPTQGCFKKCCRTSYRTSSGFPQNPVPSSEEAARLSTSKRLGTTTTSSSKSRTPNTAGSANGWMNFAFDDGAHVREMR